MALHTVVVLKPEQINAFLRRRVKAGGECTCGRRFFWGDDPHSVIQEHLQPGDSYKIIEVSMPKIKIKFDSLDAEDPNIEPERVPFPPTEPPSPRFTKITPTKNKTETYGDTQVTEVYTNLGSLIIRVFHVPDGTSLSVWAKKDETPQLTKVRAMRMMAAALRASSLGGMQ